MERAVTEIPVRRYERFPRTGGLIAAVLFVVGVLGWAAALSVDADRAWRAYLFNWLFWTGLGFGTVMFAAALVIVRAIWARTVRRIALSTIGFLPIAVLLMIPLFFVGPHILPWVRYGAGQQAAYLNMPFLTARNLVMMSLLTLVAYVFAYWALRPDAGLMRESGDAAASRGIFGFLSRGWRGIEQEEVRATRRLGRLAPIFGLVYAFTFTIVAFDFILSLEDEWWSTLIGPYFFAGAFLSGIALTAFLSVVHRKRLGLESLIDTPQLHDLGKLTFAFCVFWAYLFWAQYIVIWYGQLPSEQAFVVHRLGGVFRPLSITVLSLIFIVPFFGLLGVLPKKTPAWLGGATLVILIGLWFERYILTYPSYYVGADSIPLGWPEVVTGLAFAGVFSACVMWFPTKFPILQMWEPYYEPELAERPDEFQTAT